MQTDETKNWKQWNVLSYSLSEWQRQQTQITDPELRKNLSGLPVQVAAVKLNVSRQRIYQVLDQNRLDMLIIHRDGDLFRAPIMRLITDASIERYAKQRRHNK